MWLDGLDKTKSMALLDIFIRCSDRLIVYKWLNFDTVVHQMFWRLFYILWITYLAYFSVYFQKLLSKLLWPLLNNHLFRSVSFTMSFDQLLRQIWPCITVLMYWTQTIVYILVKSSIHLLQWIDKRDSRYHSLTSEYSVVLASIYELLNIYSSYFREEKNWGSMADWHWLMNWLSNTYQFSWLIWH